MCLIECTIKTRKEFLMSKVLFRKGQSVDWDLEFIERDSFLLGMLPGLQVEIGIGPLEVETISPSIRPFCPECGMSRLDPNHVDGPAGCRLDDLDHPQVLVFSRNGEERRMSGDWFVPAEEDKI